MITREYFIETMPPDQDYVALAISLRKAGNDLAAAANRVVSEWDGHHRLCIALAAWYTTVANERGHTQNPIPSEQLDCPWL